MYKTVLMNADVDKRPEISDVGHDAGQLHAYGEVVHGLDALGKLKLLNLFARVAARLFKFLQDIGERGQTHFVVNIPLYIYVRAKLFLTDEVGNLTVQVAGHLFYERIAFGMYSAVVEWVPGTGDA